VSLLPLFVDRRYEVRSGWKFAAYAAIFIVLLLALNIAVGVALMFATPGVLLLPRTDVRFLGLNALVLLIPSVVSLLVMTRIEKVPVSVFGVSLHEGWLHDFLSGLLVAGGLLLLTLAGSFLFGHARVESSGSVSVIPAILATLLVLAVSAMNEELVFRGYPFQVFLKSLRPWGAMLLISFIFGLLHAPNPGATPLSILNTILAGVFLCRAYLMTRSLWLPYGIHFGWNAGLSVVLGYPVSGIDTPSILKTSVVGSDFILGGSYGPEGGVLGTVLFLTATIVIGWLPIGRVSPKMRESLTAHADKVYIEET
jgi:membrane protease YdiL (CAAX protease family)